MVEGPAVPSFFIDLSYYYDSSRDPRSAFYNQCPPFIVDKGDGEEAFDIDVVTMQVIVQNLIQRGFMNVHLARNSAA